MIAATYCMMHKSMGDKAHMKNKWNRTRILWHISAGGYCIGFLKVPTGIHNISYNYLHRMTATSGKGKWAIFECGIAFESCPWTTDPEKILDRINTLSRKDREVMASYSTATNQQFKICVALGKSFCEGSVDFAVELFEALGIHDFKNQLAESMEIHKDEMHLRAVKKDNGDTVFGYLPYTETFLIERRKDEKKTWYLSLLWQIPDLEPLS